MISDKLLIDKVNKLQEDLFTLNKLFELGKVVNQALDINDLSERLITFFSFIYEIENIAIFLEKKEVYEIIASKNISIPDDFVFKNEGEGIWKLLYSGKPVRVLDNEGDAIFSSFFKDHDLTLLKSDIWLPLLFEGSIIGVISIGIKNNNEQFSKEDIDLFEKILDYITPVYNKFIKQGQKEKELQSFQKTIHNISILYNIGQAMNFIDDLKGLLGIILDKAINTIKAEKGSLMLYDISSNDLTVKVVYGLPDKEVEDKINEGIIECTKIKVGEGIAGSVFLEKSPMITNLGVNDPRFAKSDKSGNVSSILCVPLVVKGEAIGVINITNKKDGKLFNQHDLEFMEALANQAAIAIDNAQLYELATKDGLTKLYIYRQFYSLLENEIKRSLRYEHPVTVLMMDIDNFKTINDTYGHKMGDQVLREISSVITQSIRKIDIPARYGGEEFALILPETCAENARILADRLRKNIEKISVQTKDGADIKPTISIGMAEIPTDASDCHTIIEKADNALYYAKRNGKNRVAQYAEEGCFVVTEC